MTTHFINGLWQVGQGAEFSSIDPSKNEVVWTGNAASAEQVESAISAARQAFLTWSSTTLDERIEIVERFVELLKQNKEHLALCIAKEMGKPLWESATEIAGMIGKGAISIKSYHERTGETENPMPIGKAFIRHKPHGVVAIFGPYNFPGHLPNGHIIPALIAGNCIVFKPSELTPMMAQETIKLWEQAGLPQGVINLVQGEVETGKALASNRDIDGLFFTGSSRTGKILHEQFAGHPGKILALEMGGNNPLIVKDVSDIDAAVHDIIQSAFVTSGQRCTCSRRLFIEDNEQGNAVLARLVEVTKQIKVGAYDAQPQPFMGAMVSAKAANLMVAAQDSLIELGATSLLALTQPESDKGFVTPGILDVTAIAAQIPDEEHFGPLLQIYRYSDFDQAIEQANHTSFGLSAGLLGDNEQDYQYFYQRIRAGIVNWNRPITGASGAAPFGGVGESGNHRASAYYAADYCSYPVASVELEQLTLPEKLAPGLSF